VIALMLDYLGGMVFDSWHGPSIFSVEMRNTVVVNF
jgi:hypothetical protein